jgi:hypothetical protein
MHVLAPAVADLRRLDGKAVLAAARVACTTADVENSAHRDDAILVPVIVDQAILA